MRAEFDLAQAERQTDLTQKVTLLRNSAQLFPLDRRYRIASALLIANIAVQIKEDNWKRFAIPEVRKALMTDPTSADLLAMLIMCELALGQNADAQADFDQFKHVAKISPLIAMLQGKTAMENPK
jgi:hypothetical protein